MAKMTAPPPLVLLPGFLSDARLWAAQIEAMSARHTLILAPLSDGASVEDMARATLDSVPRTFAVAGHSLGAAVAMEMLRRAPERVQRIALVSAGCMSEPASVAADRETRMARVKAGRLEQVLAEEFPDDCAAPGEMQADIAAFLRAMAAELGPEVYLRQSRAMQRRPDQQRALRSARIPALIIAGRLDAIVLPRRQQFVAELMPRGAYVEVEAGHVPTIEAPDAVTAILEDWLARETQPLVLKK